MTRQALLNLSNAYFVVYSQARYSAKVAFYKACYTIHNKDDNIHESKVQQTLLHCDIQKLITKN